MQAITLSIGHELTTGHTVDTNAAWLAEQLAEIGIAVARHVIVPDDLAGIVAELRRAADDADVVIVSGGLGPTADDLTREALAQAANVPLELRPEWVERIRAFFATRSKPMPEANTVQAMFPTGSTALENNCGTAPGIAIRIGCTDVYAMPGVPREMKEMFTAHVRPALAARSGGGVLLTRLLRCYGAGESEIGERIRDLMARDRNPSVGTNVQQTIITLRVTATAGDRISAEAMLDETAAEIRRRFGTLVYGESDDTLATVVGSLLKSRGLTVTTAESCTGGMLAAAFTDVPGSSAYFLDGVVTYSNAAKTRLLRVPAEMIASHGAVSAPVAGAMARGVREQSGSDYAMSVTGIAGPDGGTSEKPVGLVFIGMATPVHCVVTEHRLGSYLTRMEIRERTCKIALHRLRMELLGGSNT